MHIPNSIVPEAKLQTITPEGWSFAITAEPLFTEVVASETIVRWGGWSGIVRQQAVWLSDGSWLVGEVQLEGASSLKIDSDWLEIPAVDLSTVRGFVVNPPASLSKWLELQQQMLAAEGGQDVVWLRNKQRVSGIIRWPANADVNQQFTLDSRDQVTTIDFENVEAIVFSPALVGPLPKTAPLTIGLNDGALLRLQEFSAASQRGLEMLLLSNIQIKSLDSPPAFASAVQFLAGSPAGVTFLSDLPPTSYRSASESKLEWELGIDQDVYGKPLIWNDGIVPKGLSLHSSSRVAYRWDGSAGNFLAQAVLAPPNPTAVPSLGSVVCQILIARGGKLETVEEFKLSRPMAPSTNPVAQLVNVDLTGAQLIVLIVEKSDYGQYGDHVLWLDARISR